MWLYCKQHRSKFQPSAPHSIENDTPSLVQKFISLKFFIPCHRGHGAFPRRIRFTKHKSRCPQHQIERHGTGTGIQIKQSGVVGPEKLKILHVFPEVPRVLEERGEYTGECPTRCTHDQQRSCWSSLKYDNIFLQWNWFYLTKILGSEQPVFRDP